MSGITDPSEKIRLRLEAMCRRDANPVAPGDTAAVASLFFENVALVPDGAIAAYWPKPGEFDTKPLIGRLLDAGMTVALPVMQPDGLVLRFARWDGRAPLDRGPFGILQPAGDSFLTPAIVIVPLLAFDAQGGRLGYGGGYYDATLAALRAARPTLAVGVAAETQRVETPLPQEPHDQKLDAIVTPRNFIAVAGPQGTV